MNSNTKVSTKVVLILLIVVTAFLNFFVPMYNFVNPKLAGIPFFYWFQMLLLGASTAPYLAFTYIERRRSLQAEYEVPVK